MYRASAFVQDMPAEPIQPITVAETAVRGDPATNVEGALQALRTIGGNIDTLSVTIADLNGTVGDVSATLSEQAVRLAELTGALNRIEEANHAVETATDGAITLARKSHAGLTTTSTSIKETLTTAVADLTGMATASRRLTSQLETVVSDLKAIYTFSESIQAIAMQTQLLAINAGIMAARAGPEGRGFAVIAENVKQLADKTSTTSRDVIQRLGSLRTTVGGLQTQSQENSQAATSALERTDRVEKEIASFETFTGTVSTMIERIESVADPLSSSQRLIEMASSEADGLDQGVQTSVGRLQSLTGQFDRLVSFSEDLIGHVAKSGIETADTPLIARCMADAKAVGEMLEATIDAGEISRAHLFDENYREIQGSDPVQVMTRFTAHFDKIMPAFQEPMLTADPRVVFCAAIDRNGYIPTHNNQYSQAQSDDPVWNAANCRNRRLFQDRTGLAAGRNTRPFLLQTYRRDMGGGVFHLMKDLSAPIIVHGRHWGGLRIGFRTTA